ncbi:NAD(P)-binding protein [Nocardioides antri]|uniref:NAD(P)-binding protein n=1 Tax=Nocardioides antri TaxID=2607659 RepID=UPI001CB70F9D|nr:NAD(P)-binding protein [Nocardioides antri]
MSATGDESVIRADVCVVGAGIAGLNALYVASRYLRRDQRIVLVDRNDRVGGMWVDTYDYVRLHQPHAFFTAGDVKWTFGKPPGHLSTKTEVLDHLRHCLDEAAKAVQVTELFGHELERAEEDGDVVVATCRGRDGSPVRVVADKLINAVGLSIEANPSLALSSKRVRSVSPENCDMRDGPIAADDAPVWVIGSGKTGMDTVHALITNHPGRDVNLIAGTGTFFVNRDRFYPTGASRWWRGTRPNWFVAEMANRFDGTNEAEVATWARETAGLWATPRADHLFIGLISEAEIERIRAGLRRVVMDHLVDAVDPDSTDGPVRVILRSGDHVDIEPGSWIVNCTSHFDFTGRPTEPPYVSPSGRSVRIGATGMFGFSSFAGYFLTHLLFLDKITTVPLYTLDGIALFQRSPLAGVTAAMTLAQYNLGQVADHVPAKVFQQCGLDFDRWYPLPRRFAGQVQFLVAHKRRRAQYRRALDVVGERFGIAHGPVVDAEASAVG